MIVCRGRDGEGGREREGKGSEKGEKDREEGKEAGGESVNFLVLFLIPS